MKKNFQCLVIFFLTVIFSSNLYAVPYRTLEETINRCEIYRITQYGHLEQSKKIAQLENKIKKLYNINITTSVPQSFKGLNSRDGRPFNPSDDVYLKFLQTFLKKAQRDSLSPRYVPVTKGILSVTVIKSDYKLYGYSNFFTYIYKKDNRIYIRDNSVGLLYDLISDENGIFPSVGSEKARLAYERREAIIRAILNLGQQLESHGYFLTSLMVLCHYNILDSKLGLQLHLSYFDQDLLLKGMMNALKDVEEGKKPVEGKKFFFVEGGGLGYIISNAIGSMFFYSGDYYPVSRSEVKNNKELEEMINDHM